MIPVVFSECLLGGTCRFDRTACTADAVCRLAQKVKPCVVCPEVQGGLTTPRLPAERVGRRVIRKDGADVTAAFIDGAHKALESALMADARLAILKAKSPSCGSDYVLDGTFTGRLVPGEGLTCELFRRSGIAVFTEATVADHEMCSSCPIALLVHQDFDKIIGCMHAHQTLAMTKSEDIIRHIERIRDSDVSAFSVGTFGEASVVVYRVDGAFCREMVDACLHHAYEQGARQAITWSVDADMAKSLDVLEITGPSVYRRDAYLFTILREIVRAEGIEMSVHQRGRTSRHTKHCDKIPCPTFEHFTIFLQRLLYLLSHD